MWTLDTEYNKWYRQTDSLTKENYDYLKQTLDSVRFYSKCLSGATYYPVNDLDNIYDILGSYVPRNWYVSSPYSITSIPTINPRAISATTSTEYFDKYSKEYGLTLKNLFTPKRLIDDSLNNFIYVDVCSTEEIIMKLLIKLLDQLILIITTIMSLMEFIFIKIVNWLKKPI